MINFLFGVSIAFNLVTILVIILYFNYRELNDSTFQTDFFSDEDNIIDKLSVGSVKKCKKK